MATQPTEQRTPDDKSETDIDKAAEDSFPASDPPSTGGATKIGSDRDSDTSGIEDGADEPPDEKTPEADAPRK